MQQTGAPAVAIVTVNFHTEAEILRLLATVRERRPFRGARVVLVDNSPGHGVDFPLGPDGQYLPQGSNLGFGPACNLGVKAAETPYIFFANPDLEFTGPLDGLIDRLSGTVVAACPLIEPAGFFQNRRLPTVGRFAWDFLGMPQLFPGNAVTRRFYYLPPPAVPFEVEQPAAAAVLLPRERFLELGGFDEVFLPAWWEDVDLFTRIRQKGWKAVCDPAFRVRHEAGKVAGHLGRSRFFELYGANCVRYFRKHHGGAATAAVKAVLWLGLLLRFLRGRVGPALAWKAWAW
jgi:GT2 family glycosyltransferase